MYRFELNKKDIALASLSGIFIFLSFPKCEWTGFIWISFIPLFFALRDKSPKQAFWLGFIMGYVVSFTLFYWVVYTLKEFGQISIFFAIPLFLVFCTFCNLQYALFTYVMRRFHSYPIPLLWIPLLYTIIEFLCPQIFRNYLGSCLYKKLWLIQTADLTGVSGISFLVVLVNVFIFELIRWIKKETHVFPKFSFSVALVFMFLSCVYSHFRLTSFRDLIKNAPLIRAALIQTNIGNIEKRAASHGYTEAVQFSKAVNEKLVLESAKTKGLDLMVLPETAVPGYFTEDKPMNRAEMFHLASKTGVPLAFGGYHKTHTPEKNKIFNSFFLVSQDFQLLGHYDKIKLLTFGETLPLSSLFPFLHSWFPQIGNFSSGETIKILPLTKELKFSPLICLEGLYPSFVRKFIKMGAQFIIIITNDSWFGNTSNPYQHRMLHVWRAIENRTPILRIANTGISSFIDLTGKIQSETLLFQEKILIDEVAIIKEQSFYTRYGDFFIYGAIFLLPLLYIIFNYFIPRYFEI